MGDIVGRVKRLVGEYALGLEPAEAAQPGKEVERLFRETFLEEGSLAVGEEWDDAFGDPIAGKRQAILSVYRAVADEAAERAGVHPEQIFVTCDIYADPPAVALLLDPRDRRTLLLFEEVDDPSLGWASESEMRDDLEALVKKVARRVEKAQHP